MMSFVHVDTKVSLVAVAGLNLITSIVPVTSATTPDVASTHAAVTSATPPVTAPHVFIAPEVGAVVSDATLEEGDIIMRSAIDAGIVEAHDTSADDNLLSTDDVTLGLQAAAESALRDLRGQYQKVKSVYQDIIGRELLSNIIQRKVRRNKEKAEQILRLMKRHLLPEGAPALDDVTRLDADIRREMQEMNMTHAQFHEDLRSRVTDVLNVMNSQADYLRGVESAFGAAFVPHLSSDALASGRTQSLQSPRDVIQYNPDISTLLEADEISATVVKTNAVETVIDLTNDVATSACAGSAHLPYTQPQNVTSQALRDCAYSESVAVPVAQQRQPPPPQQQQQQQHAQQQQPAYHSQQPQTQKLPQPQQQQHNSTHLQHHAHRQAPIFQPYKDLAHSNAKASIAKVPNPHYVAPAQSNAAVASSGAMTSSQKRDRDNVAAMNPFEDVYEVKRRMTSHNVSAPPASSSVPQPVTLNALAQNRSAMEQQQQQVPAHHKMAAHAPIPTPMHSHMTSYALQQQAGAHRSPLLTSPQYNASPSERARMSAQKSAGAMTGGVPRFNAYQHASSSAQFPMSFHSSHVYPPAGSAALAQFESVQRFRSLRAPLHHAPVEAAMPRMPPHALPLPPVNQYMQAIPEYARMFQHEALSSRMQMVRGATQYAPEVLSGRVPLAASQQAPSRKTQAHGATYGGSRPSHEPTLPSMQAMVRSAQPPAANFMQSANQSQNATSAHATATAQQSGAHAHVQAAHAAAKQKQLPEQTHRPRSKTAAESTATTAPKAQNTSKNTDAAASRSRTGASGGRVVANSSLDRSTDDADSIATHHSRSSTVSTKP